MAEVPAWKDKIKQEGVDDMTLLTKIDNDCIAKNLKERFDADVIYTNIGNVLISMNPYKWVDGLYSEEVIHDYEGRSRIEMPPHVYGVAEDAYRSMMTEKENQCIIISGESGAGKTEAAKKVMEYVAAVSGVEEEEGGGTTGKGLEHVKHVILETNPLLEAFGNAKTLRNNNSSRFGKYFEIQFTSQGQPCGGNIKNYLLEKSRVVYQIPGERNFHIFYQFCKGATEDERKSFGISGAEAFSYLSYGSCFQVEHMDDVAEYNDMRNAMNVIGISPEEQLEIFNTLAAIMWLGNVDFEEKKTETSSVANLDTLDYVGSLLQVPVDFLAAGVTTRTIESKKGMARGTTYKVPLNAEQAYSARDALAKGIYSLMFNWLVTVVNRELAKHSSAASLIIGVLDIYGFEVFERNAFEQLCINYVNEKLQQIFIEFTLTLEQEEYVKEGIKWKPIDYFDNKVVCELIESKSLPGIFAVLDDVCRTVHADTKGADKSFMQRLGQCEGKKKKFFKLRGDHFLVKHYAGDVSYEAPGMIEKNKDQLSNDLIECVQMSENQFLQQLFRDVASSKTTAGHKIKSSANDLTATLSKCMPHYIRCLKPNDDKQPNSLDHKRVMHQVQYLGLLDNIKVRRAGFAYRTTFERFFQRYYLICPKTAYAAKKTWKGDDKGGCKEIVSNLHVADDQWQLGKTKIFIKDPETLFHLEDLRQNYWHDMVGRIKTAFRTFSGFKGLCGNRIKKAFKTWKTYRSACATILQTCYRNYKGINPTFQQRLQNEEIFRNNKERNRLSLLSIRKFYGDYLDVKKSQPLLQQMGPGSSMEKILFSSKGKVVTHPGRLRANKTMPRYIVLTERYFSLISLVSKSGDMVLDRQISIQLIEEAWLSPFVDNFVILKIPSEQWDIVLEVEYKTELVSWLCLKGKLTPSSVHFSDHIEYFKTKKQKNKIKFVKDEKGGRGAGVGGEKRAVGKGAEDVFKKDKVTIGRGLPSTSQVAQFSKEGNPIQQLVQVVKTEIKRPDRTRQVVRGAGRYSDDWRGRGRGRARGRGGPGRGVMRGRGRGMAGATREGGEALPTPPGGGAGEKEKEKESGKKFVGKCVTLYHYDGVEDDELTFDEGMTIQIVNKEDMWWTGVLNGKEGVFPANYVKEC